MYSITEQLQIPHGITCVIGSGGKTTLLRTLAHFLQGTVILTTSTHMYPFPGIPLIDTSVQRGFLEKRILSALSENRVICVGSLLSSGKLAIPAANADSLPVPSPGQNVQKPVPESFEDTFRRLLPLADYVLVEADGSKGLPLKAHRAWEPVIPSCTSLTIGVAGLSGIGKPLREVCHCPSLFADLAGITEGQTVKGEHIASVLNRENLADCWFLNQTDLLPGPEPALEICRLLHAKAFAGSLLENRFYTP